MILLVMGVAGCGKTTVGKRLAETLGCRFLEGDSFHPPANIEKMSRQVPLQDEDRWPWLDRMAAEIAAKSMRGEQAVLACSALKRAYRDRLRRGSSDLGLVYLQGTPDQVRARLAARQAHFMPPALLDSQFAALEAPGTEEQPITLDIDAPPEDLVAAIIERLEMAEASMGRKP